MTGRPRTEHEPAILADIRAGETIAGTARKYGVSRRTVHAVIDRNELTRRHRDTHAGHRAMAAAGRRLARVLLRHLNRMPTNSATRDELMHELQMFEAVLNEHDPQ